MNRGLHSTITLGAVVLLGSGCATNKTNSPPLTPPPSPEQIEVIRGEFTRAFPNARVGVVTAVTTPDPYAYVSQIDSAGIRLGTVISFLDANQQVIANGTVVRVDASGLTVRFDAGERAVRVGDAAVKF